MDESAGINGLKVKFQHICDIHHSVIGWCPKVRTKSRLSEKLSLSDKYGLISALQIFVCM